MMRQIDQVRVALLNRGWSTPFELQAAILERFQERLSDASITARIRELRQEGLDIPKRRRKDSKAWEYAITLTEDVTTCALLWREEIVEVGAALRTHRGRQGRAPDQQLGLLGIDAPKPLDQDTDGRRPDGGRSWRR